MEQWLDSICLVLVLIGGAGSIWQEEEDGSTYIQADEDGGLVLASKRVGGDRRNRLEEEDDRWIWHDMLLALKEVAEGGSWMPGSIGRLI